MRELVVEQRMTDEQSIPHHPVEHVGDQFAIRGHALPFQGGQALELMVTCGFVTGTVLAVDGGGPL